MPITSIPSSGQPSSGHETDFAISWRAGHDGVVVTVRGEVDMETAPELGRMLADAVDQDAVAATVYLDLREVTFLASAGLSVLIAGQRRCELADRQLVVVAVQPTVLHVLRLTELDAVLTIRPDLPLTREAG